MTKLRVFAKRLGPPPLVDVHLLSLDNFTIPTIIEIHQQLDDKEPTLVHAETFTPSTGPISPPTPRCGSHSTWDGQACVCDPGYHDEDGVCIADTIIPPADDNILYDSNKYWADGKERTVGKGGHDGDIKANGKGIFTAASGSPKVEIDGKGVATLITQPGYGRFYLCVCNFNAQLDFDFMIVSGTVDNMSIKGRCRHQSGGSNENKFGGLGNATDLIETDFKIEPYHNVHDKGYTQKLPQKLELKKWYHKRYIYHNTEDNKGIKMEDWIDFDDGKGLVKVFERTETKPISAAMNKSLFAEESWIWFRLNGSGSISFKNVKVTGL